MRSRDQNLKAVLAILMILVVACSKSPENNLKPSSDSGKATVKVATMIVTAETFEQKLTLTASTMASKSVIIASAAAGRVKNLGFDRSDKVHASQPLVWLDDSVLASELERVVADHEMASLHHEKLKALSDKGANVSELKLEEARLKLKAEGAKLSALNAKLDMMTVRAPFAGVVVTRDVEVGAYINPGQRLAKLVTITPMKIITGVPETAIADFKVGKSALVTLDAYPGKTFTAEVTSISPEVNPKTRVFDCELVIQSSSENILSEMSAKVLFTKKVLANSVLIPQTSVVELIDGHAVYVVENGSVARLKKVVIADVAEEKALVESGLSVGEHLVISGHRSLIDGDTVEVSN
jgi:membrane fusion protein (multidrug efflux system)